MAPVAKSTDSPTLLKRLRLKFVLLNMTTIVAVLVIALGSISFISYRQSMDQINTSLDSALSRIQPGGGYNLNSFGFRLFQDMGTIAPNDLGNNGLDADSGSSENSESSTGDSTESDNGSTPPSFEIGRTDSTDSASNSPVAVYYEYGGTLYSASVFATATLSDTVLANAQTQLATTSDQSGTLDSAGLFFKRRAVGGSTYVAFVDENALDSWYRLTLSLVGVGVVCFIVFLVISVFFSRWALRPVSQAWARQQQFVADASHELKTPLAVILANNSILLSKPESSIASQSQWIESTQSEAQSMQAMVEDLLLLAKMDNERALESGTTSERVDIDFSELVEGDALQFESLAFENNIALECEVEPGIHILGEPKRIGRLTSTLIDNACKYAGAGGTVNISLATETAGTKHEVVFSVQNSGPVIPAEDLPHLFERFYRADHARTRSEGSFGLGLAIAAEVAASHGGTIGVTSSEEDGTRFTVHLPASASNKKPALPEGQS